VASSLVPDLVAYQGPGTAYSGPTVGPLQDVNLDSNWSGSGVPDDVFSVFDSIIVTGSSSTAVSAHASREVVLGEVTMVASEVDRPLINLQGGLPGITDGTAIRRLSQPPAPQASALNIAVDQTLGLVLDADSRDTLIGDLAFEQVSWGVHKPKVSAGT
jgi:hypothetical protein